ncbi:General transcription and DNA repair factor IIH subunit TFB5 [Sesamum alatum]|uniref:General transcription and DNA repair factor IIH subunit TFB5 n=1 Tax=Sesamum alatum TaxID=300844 RepID=A0AAE2CV10_9LAMI|nr:General transcription and DNA repair factor IIH subunit TFB5 [Sesamum alatum]
MLLQEYDEFMDNGKGSGRECLFLARDDNDVDYGEKKRSRTLFIMVNAIKGLYISCDVPMAQFIINMNAALPQSQKFIIHVLDNTHIFVRSDVAGMIRSAIATFREQNTYEKPS